MKIAITGGDGFIGGRLTKLLQEDSHSIVSIDTHGSPAIDMMDRTALMQACKNCNVIYHLAALHSDDVFPRSRYYEVNAEGTKNVIEAAEEHNIQTIIFTSTFAIYGLDTGMPDEDSDPQPFNDYGKSKLKAENLLKAWAEENPQRTVVIVRPVVVFGEGNRGNVYTLIRQIQSGLFVMIGSGQNKKSMAYVGNVAGFLQHCLQSQNGYHVYNYADKPDLDMQNLTDIIYPALGKDKPSFSIPYALGMAAGFCFDILARITGRTFPISTVRVKKFCANTTCEAERYKKTGFIPEWTIQEGLSRMIQSDFGDRDAEG